MHNNLKNMTNENLNRLGISIELYKKVMDVYSDEFFLIYSEVDTTFNIMLDTLIYGFNINSDGRINAVFKCLYEHLDVIEDQDLKNEFKKNLDIASSIYEIKEI